MPRRKGGRSATPESDTSPHRSTHGPHTLQNNSPRPSRLVLASEVWLARSELDEEAWFGGRRDLGLVACVSGDKRAPEGEEGVWLERGCVVSADVTVWRGLPVRDCSRLQQQRATLAIVPGATANYLPWLLQHWLGNDLGGKSVHMRVWLAVPSS